MAKPTKENFNLKSLIMTMGIGLLLIPCSSYGWAYSDWAIDSYDGGGGGGDIIGGLILLALILIGVLRWFIGVCTAEYRLWPFLLFAGVIAYLLFDNERFFGQVFWWISVVSAGLAIHARMGKNEE